MMEMGSMPGGSFPPPGVLCSVKSDHDLCTESVAFLYRKEVTSANFRKGFEQLSTPFTARLCPYRKRGKGPDFPLSRECPNNHPSRSQGTRTNKELYMATADALINAMTTMLVTLDPPGLAPVFLGLTVGMTAAQRKQVALRGSIIGLGILTVFALFGAGVLGLLGISMGAFRIAGGLLLFWISFEMVFEKRQERKEKTSQAAITIDHIRDLAVFPLAIPLIAGPGAISATVLLAGTFTSPFDRALLISVIALMMIILYVTLLLAERLDRFLGVTGRAILTRLLGVLLAALSVQFVVDGVRSAFNL